MNQNLIAKSGNKKTMLKKFALIALVLTAFTALLASTGMLPALAANVSTTALDSVMDIVIDVIGKAALYIGIVIVLWGVFQIVFLLRVYILL